MTSSYSSQEIISACLWQIVEEVHVSYLGSIIEIELALKVYYIIIDNVEKQAGAELGQAQPLLGQS